MRAHQRKENTQCNTIYSRYTHCDYSARITIYGDPLTININRYISDMKNYKVFHVCNLY